MKKLLSFCLLLLSIFSFAQINFEKAYFINNNDERVECLIKNVEWKFNPKSFNYKLSSDSEEKTASIKDVKEFEIYNQSHYIRANVKIDASNEEITQLSHDEKPEFVEEELFLKRLVNGKANLYRYADDKYGLKFFYGNSEGEIEQLVYKLYYYDKGASETNSTTFTYNETYKNQLRNALKCDEVNQNDFNKIPYKQSDLTKVFVKYNECADPNFVQKTQAKKTNQFHVSLRPRINFNSLSLKDNTFTDKYFDAESKTTFGFGVEFEYVLPINKNKWAIIFEPTYQYYQSESETDIDFYLDKRLTTVDYKAIELPIGIRHYLFLNQKSKFFLNAQFVLSLNMSSSLTIERPVFAISNSYRVKTSPNLAVGVGYNFGNKFAAEVRYFTTKNITNYDRLLDTQYKSLSLILSYSVF